VSNRPLLVFDFDGVIVDGMEEYWWSARAACLSLLPSSSNAEDRLPVSVPEVFRQLRPWIHHGWEMVLIAVLLQDPEAPLLREGVEDFVQGYAHHCKRALVARGWTPPQLQVALEQVRSAAVAEDRSTWLARHRPFAGVPERLRRFGAEGFDWAVLTTKGRAFTAELLDGFALRPQLLFGHEAGTKPDVLLQLRTERSLAGFVEDRRPTLETVKATSGLETLPCFLADWGYLRPHDREALPQGIHLLDQARMLTPLADWT